MSVKKEMEEDIRTKNHIKLENQLRTQKVNQKFLNESLKWACFEGDSYSIDLLLKSGANINSTDEFGTTGLHFAIKSGQEDVVVTLLNHGANYLDWAIDGINLLQWCVRHGLVKVLDLLIKKFDMDIRRFDDMGRTGLHTACMYGQAMVAEYILDNNLLSVDERDENGWTPLHYACSEAGSNFRSMIEILFKFQADPILLTLNNKTSLDLAYESGKAQQLIDVLKIHKMMQLLISVDSVIVGSSIQTNTTQNQDVSTGNEENANNLVRKEATKTPEQQMVLKLSIWRKVLLNDDIEILEELRDSGMWCNSEETLGFEESQGLTKEHFLEIFNDSYENGIGLFSYFNNNFKKEISKMDFYSIMIEISGLTKFQCLEADDIVLFGGFHESILFLALITGRFGVVEMLLKMRQFDMIPSCLMVCLITKRIHFIKQFPPQIVENLRSLSYKSELIAVDVLSRVYFKDTSLDKQVTLQFIDCELSSYGGKSMIDLADLANCSVFLSLPCCQLILDRRWYGNMKPLRSNLKWIIRFIPLLIVFYNPYDQKDIPTNGNKRSLEYLPTDINIDMKNKRKGNKRVSELGDFQYQDRGQSSSNSLYVLFSVANAPGTKFFYHSAAHFVFLIMMSNIMLFSYGHTFTVDEICCYLFVFGYGIEEFCQTVTGSSQCSMLAYLRDKWNWLDLSAIFTTVIGLILKLSHFIVTLSNITDYDDVVAPLHYYSRVALLFSLLLFYLRILFIVSISAILGPKLRMIGDMLRKDFLPLLMIFLIFILAFGIFFQGILYPNGWLYHRNSTLPNMKVAEGTLEIVQMLLRRAIYGMFEADYPNDEINCEKQKYCVHYLGRTIFMSFGLIMYLVIVYTMLMNLLIALFSNTVARIDERSTEHWLAGRYKLIEEYQEKTILPPPFNIPEHIFHFILYMTRKSKCLYCSKRLLWTFKSLRLPKSEVNIVVKFIIIQAFALKTCRYILGTKERNGPSAHEKTSEMEIRLIKDKLNQVGAKVDNVVSLLVDRQPSHLAKNMKIPRGRRFSNFKL